MGLAGGRRLPAGRRQRVLFPEAELIGARRLREQQAKAICATCPVMEPCRSHALIRRELYGVWGGLTERERATIWAVTDPQPASDGYPA